VYTPAKVIPAVYTPAKVIPAVYTPAKVIPAVYTPAKVIPAVVIPGKCVGRGRWKVCSPDVTVTPEIRIPRKLVTPEIKIPRKLVTPEIRIPPVLVTPEIRIPPVLVTPEIRIPEVRTPGFTIPSVKSPEFKSPSVGIAASTTAKAGLESKLKIEGGTVNSFIPINLFLEIPDGKVKSGETITIKSGFSVADGATFSTASPIASYILDLVFGLNAKSGFQVGANGIPIFDFNIPETRTNFLNLNPQNASFGVPLGDVGSLNVKVPTVNTKGIFR
jgi:hypothetical protein